MQIRIILLLCFLIFSQHRAVGQFVENDQFDRKIKSYLTLKVPVIGVDEAFKFRSQFKFIDIREREEFEVSHIPNAIYGGYDDFDISNLSEIEKGQEIIVYCSIGYRSEKVGSKLKKAGYQNVRNLYGSIFEWVNRGYPVVDSSGNPTKKIHAYNKSWSKWIVNKEISKVW